MLLLLIIMLLPPCFEYPRRLAPWARAGGSKGNPSRELANIFWTSISTL